MAKEGQNGISPCYLIKNTVLVALEKGYSLQDIAAILACPFVECCDYDPNECRMVNEYDPEYKRLFVEYYSDPQLPNQTDRFIQKLKSYVSIHLELKIDNTLNTPEV